MNGGSEREGKTAMDERNKEQRLLVDEFETRWTAAGGHIFEADGDDGLVQAIVEAWDALVGTADENKPCSVVYWVNEDVRNLPWGEIFPRIGPIVAYPWDPKGDMRALTSNAAMGITGCAWAVAETGTVALIAAPETGLLPSILPSAHLVLINRRQIVRTVRDGLRSLSLTALPPILKLVTGPSMTADIEGELVIGVHGPARVGALLYELPPST